MGTWFAEFFGGHAGSPSLALELFDFSLALEAACEIDRMITAVQTAPGNESAGSKSVVFRDRQPL
jgi:hypothetical protein